MSGSIGVPAIFLALVVVAGNTASLADSDSKKIRPHANLTSSKKVLAVEDLMKMTAIISYEISPNGRSLAVIMGVRTPGFVATSSRGLEDSFTTNLQVVDVATGATAIVDCGGHSPSRSIWSPNGKYLAFIAGQSDQARLWVWSTDSGHSQRVSDTVIPQMITGKMEWTIDGRSVLLSTVPAEETNEALIRHTLAQPELTDGVYPMDTHTPGAKVAVYQANQRPSEIASANHSGAASVVPRAMDDRWRASYSSDVSSIEVVSGQVRTIAAGYRPIFWHQSPNGRWLVLGHFKGMAADGLASIDLDLVDLDTAHLHTLLSNMSIYNNVFDTSWSSDSRALAFCRDQASSPGTAVCYRLDVAADILYRNNNAIVPNSEVGAGTFAAPLWDPNGDFLYAQVFIESLHGTRLNIFAAKTLVAREISLPDSIAEYPSRPLFRDGGREAITTSQNDHQLVFKTLDQATKQAGFYALDIQTAEVRRLYEAPVALGEDVAVSNSPRIIAYTEEQASVPPEIWITDVRFKERHQITHFNSRVRDFGLGKSRLVTWRTPSGDQLRGALLLPADYVPGRRYPLVVTIYLRGVSNALNHFGLAGLGLPASAAVSPIWENLQPLASRGYAVLAADTQAHLGTPMADIPANFLPGVNAVIDAGIADQNQLGLIGHSYGGYGVLATLVQSGRFKAAVVESAYTSLIGPYSNMSPDGSAVYADQWLGSIAHPGQARMSGSLWEYRSSYIENSPLFYLDRITTPILALYGEFDANVPVHEGDQLFVSLRAVKKDVQYAKYLGEGHVVSGWANSIDYENRIVDWFDAHLRGDSTESNGAKANTIASSKIQLGAQDARRQAELALASNPPGTAPELRHAVPSLGRRR